MLSSSVTLPAELLKSADDLSRGQRKPSRLRVSYWSADGKPVKTHSGLKLAADYAYQDLIPSAPRAQTAASLPDVVFIPAVWRHASRLGDTERKASKWIRDLAIQNPDCLFAAVSTGAFILAHSGMLAGQQATTHWAYLKTLAMQYPNIYVKSDRFITESDNKFCSGSVNSAADITVELVRRFYDKDIARTIARHYFHELRERSGQDERWMYNSQATLAHADEDIVDLQEYIHSNLATVSANELKARFGFSQRTLNRRFKNAVGLTPIQYLHQKRIELALSLLKGTNLTVEEIATRSGFSETSFFNRVFKRETGAAPRDYRSTVRAKLFKQ